MDLISSWTGKVVLVVFRNELLEEVIFEPSCIQVRKLGQAGAD